MKRTLFVGITAAGLMAGTSVLAHGDQAKTDQSKTTTQATTTEKSTPATTATSEGSLSGKITSIDKQSKSVTIASDTGTQQQVTVSDKTNIMRDGSSVSFTQLQSGDQVRASFDPSTKQATTLEVQSKEKKQ